MPWIHSPVVPARRNQKVISRAGADAQLHGHKDQQKDVVVDTAVQEKNITYPIDTELPRKIIQRC